MDNALIDLYKKSFHLKNATFTRIEHSDAIIATVYKISQPNGKEYILKICPRKEHYFCEAYFLKYFADSLPVSHIINLIKPESHVNGAILMEYLSGSLLKKENLTEPLAYEIGSLLAKIHSNKTNGYGDLTQPHMLKQDACSYFTYKFEEEFNECKDNVPNELLDQCLFIYNNNIKFLDFVDGPCITHRDYRPSNVIINDTKYKGLLIGREHVQLLQKKIFTSWNLENGLIVMI